MGRGAGMVALFRQEGTAGRAVSIQHDNVIGLCTLAQKGRGLFSKIMKMPEHKFGRI